MTFREAENHFEAQSAQDAVVELSGALKVLAVSLTKICNDLRWMSSGPRAGLGEIRLPDLQPGSSIMPGKVNPVVCEATLMACAQVVGNDATITAAGAAGSFELNVMLPVMARNILESTQLLAATSRLLADRCVDGIEADEERCRDLAEGSPSIVTPLNRFIGYEAAAASSSSRSASGGRSVTSWSTAGTSPPASSPRSSSTRHSTCCGWRVPRRSRVAAAGLSGSRTLRPRASGRPAPQYQCGLRLCHCARALQGLP